MTAYIVQVSLGDTPHGTLEYQTIFAVGTTLFLITMALNLLSFRFLQALPGDLPMTVHAAPAYPRQRPPSSILGSTYAGSDSGCRLRPC
jgi:hypothetical protein